MRHVEPHCPQHPGILDSELARIYGVPTFRFNEAIKRNRHRFPPDFMFQLTREEFDSLKSQVAMSKAGRGGRRTVPYAFTEHGALQAANVLRSQRAVQMSVFVIRAFVKMREALRGTPELARKLAALEKKLTARLDVHEAAIVQVLREVMQILNPPPEPEPPRGREVRGMKEELRIGKTKQTEVKKKNAVGRKR